MGPGLTEQPGRVRELFWVIPQLEAVVPIGRVAHICTNNFLAVCRVRRTAQDRAMSGHIALNFQHSLDQDATATGNIALNFQHNLHVGSERHCDWRVLESTGNTTGIN